jgi:hypothetical protein
VNLEAVKWLEARPITTDHALGTYGYDMGVIQKDLFTFKSDHEQLTNGFNCSWCWNATNEPDHELIISGYEEHHDDV